MAIQLPKKVTDAVGFIDGVGMAGRFGEATLPDLEFVTERARGGGLGGGVPISMHKIEDMEMTLSSDGVTNDMTRTLGKPGTPFTLRANATDGAANIPVEIFTRGLFTKFGMGSLGGDNATGSPEYVSQLTYYRCVVAGEELCEVDIEARICRIHGEDLWADVNANLGV